jgi:ATP-dependent Clp protease ATP-binding subunit ClpC
MGSFTLSEDTKSVVDQAQQIAKQRKHEEVDSAHLFYALLKESKAGKEWINQAEPLEVEKLFSDFDEALSAWYPTPSKYLEPSEKYLQVMRSAEKLAASLNAKSVTPAHLLKVILERDTRLTGWISHHVHFLAVARVSPDTPTLDLISRDLTLLAKENKLTPVIGREKEVQGLIETLLKRGKNSVLLLGPAGVGKTAIVERLAQDIIGNKVPDKLKNVRLVELNLGALVAGTKYRGEFEERMQSLIKEVEADRNIVLVIDEFHALMNTGKVEGGGPDAVSILKPSLARGDITCIGITTNEDFTRFVEDDSALVRRFEVINVTEPTIEEVLNILEQIYPKYTGHHNVEIQQPTLKIIVRWSDWYQPTRHFPDKAIDILGKACARAELKKQAIVTLALIAEVMTEITGIPVGDLDTDLRQVLVNLEDELNQRVIGQEDAIQILSQTIKLSYTGVRDPRKPKGVFLFLGPSGVGKTETARALTEKLFGAESSLIRLDMSEYAERANISRLIGSAPGYIGYEEPGQLTQALRDRPHSVVLLDEIEKACPDIFDLFLQLFDEGRLTDSHGRLANGRNAIFILTSNLNIKKDRLRLEGKGFIKSPLEQEQDIDESKLQQHFRPEFVNRIDRIIQFRSLDTDDLMKIVDFELRRLSQRLEEQKVTLTYETDIFPLIVKEARKDSGARGINSAIEKVIQVPISEILLRDVDPHNRSIHIYSTGKNILLEWK